MSPKPRRPYLRGRRQPRRFEEDPRKRATGGVPPPGTHPPRGSFMWGRRRTMGTLSEEPPPVAAMTMTLGELER